MPKCMPVSIIVESLPLSSCERYNICVVPPESTGGVSKVIVVCSPTRVHIVDYITSSSIPVSPTRSSLTTQNNLREVPAQFKTLHFESEVVFVGAGIGVATVACHNGQVFLLTERDLKKCQRIGEHRGVRMALLCEDETKMVTAGLLEPPKLLFLNGLTTMDDNHQCYRVAAPSSSIFLSNADHDFAPPTCMVEWDGGCLVADQMGHIHWCLWAHPHLNEVAQLGEPAIALLQLSNNIPMGQLDDDYGDKDNTAAIIGSSVLVVGASGSLLIITRRNATDKGTGLDVTAYPSLCISVTSACICIRDEITVAGRKSRKHTEDLIILSERRVYCAQLPFKNVQCPELSLVPISHPILAMCATKPESVGLGIPSVSNLLLLSSEGCVLSLPWVNFDELNAAAQSMDTKLISNSTPMQEEIRGQVKEILLHLPLVSSARAALEAKRSLTGDVISALRSVAEALFATQIDNDDEGSNGDGLVVTVEWKLHKNEVSRVDNGCGGVCGSMGDIKVVSELSLILPESTAVAIDVANKNSNMNLSWVHHVLITLEEPGKTSKAWSVSAPIDTAKIRRTSSVALPFTPHSLHPLYVRSWVEFHWGEEKEEEGFSGSKMFGTDEKKVFTHPGACFRPTPPGKCFDVLDWPCGTKIDNVQASATRLLQPLPSRSTVQQHTFTVNVLLPQSDEKGMSIATMKDLSLTLLGDEAIEEAQGIFRTSLSVAGERATVYCRPLSPPDILSKPQIVSTVVVSSTCTSASLAAAVRQAVIRRARAIVSCEVKIPDIVSSAVLLSDDLDAMLNQRRFIEVYDALR